MPANVIIRPAKTSDAAAIRRLYAPYVTHTAITFDEKVPTVAAMAHKIRDIKKTHPFLVAEHNDKLVGYAYATPFRPRASFRWSVETTVYVDPNYHRRGIARALYKLLLRMLKRQNFVTAYAVITLPGPASVALHESFGFKPIAVLKNTGYKLAAWRDVGLWEMRLNEPTGNPTEPG